MSIGSNRRKMRNKNIHELRQEYKPIHKFYGKFDKENKAHTAWSAIKKYDEIHGNKVRKTSRIYNKKHVIR